MMPRPVQRPLALAGGSVNQPCCDDVLLEPRVEPRHVLAQREELLGVDELRRRRRCSGSRLEQELGALVHRPRARPLESRHLHRVLGRRLGGPDRQLRALRDQAGLLRLELDEAARREVEARRRQRPAGRLAVADDGARRRRQAGRRRRDVDRRVVEVDGVATVAVPGEQRAADDAARTAAARRAGRAPR